MTKDDFKKKDGRTILSSAKEIANWVKLGFEEQKINQAIFDIEDRYRFIDLSNCILYTSSTTTGNLEHESKIFNLCDLADIVPNIYKTNNDDDYRFEVNCNIRFNNSILFGNFFHYVHFKGDLLMIDCEVISTCSFFKVKVDGLFRANKFKSYNFNIENSSFNSVNLRNSTCQYDGIYLNHIIVDKELDISNINLNTNEISIHIRNSNLNLVNISDYKNSNIFFIFENSIINHIKSESINTKGIEFRECEINGLSTFVTKNSNSNINDKDNNIIHNLIIWNCTVSADIHIENTRMEEFHFIFSRIARDARVRIYKCLINECTIKDSSNYGRFDLSDSECDSLDMDYTYSLGSILFERNKVTKYKNRHTVTLLKNETLKMNDNIAYLNLYKEEIKLYKEELKKSKILNKNRMQEMVTLFCNWISNNYGSSWLRALKFVLISDFLFTFIILLFGVESIYYDIFVKSNYCEYISNLYLNILNIFSIANMSNAVQEFHLNLYGELFYIIAEIFIAYGTYQFVSAFRKLNRK